MDQTLYQSGLEVAADDLNNTHDTKQTNLRKRFIELGAYGVVEGLVLSGIAGQISISAGSAFDADGERIVLSTASVLDVAVADINKYVLVRGTQVDGSLREHPRTGQRAATRRTVEAHVYLSTVTETGAVSLGQVAGIGSNGVPLFSSTNRVEWSATIEAGYITDAKLDPEGTVLAHVASYGTGVYTTYNPHRTRMEDLGWRPDTTPQDHQLRDHADGIEPEGSTAGVVTPAVNSATITQIPSQHTMLIGGVRLVAGGISGSPLSWGGDVRPGMYEIYVQKPLNQDTAGAAGKSLRAVYLTTRATTGIQIVDVSAKHKTGAFVLAMDYVGTSRIVRWNDGNPVTVTADGIVDLYGHDGEGITVYIKFASLLAVSVTDVVEIKASVYGRDRFALANLFWFGSASGALGYGVEGTGGNSYDKRVFGSLAYRNLAPSGKEAITRLVGELRRDGFVSGGEAQAVEGFRVLVRRGVVWLEGIRTIVRSAEVVLPPNAVSVLTVKKDGGIAVSLDDPDGIHVSVPERFARIARVTTGQTGIISIQDDRAFLPLADTRPRLGAGSKHNSYAQLFPRIVIPQGPYGVDKGKKRARTKLLYAQESRLFHPVNVYLTSYQYDETDPETGQVRTKNLSGLEFAFNCTWTIDYTPGVDAWVPTSLTQNALLYGWDQDGQYVRSKRFATFAGSWYDTSADGTPTWDEEPFKIDLRNGRIYVKTASATTNNTIMTLGTGYTNQLTPVNIPKAWAVINLAKGGGMRVIHGFNVKRQLVDDGGTPGGVYLYLASTFQNYDANTPAGCVLVSDDRGLYNPDAPIGIDIRGKLINVGGAPLVQLKSKTGTSLSATGAATNDNRVATIYVLVMGAQQSPGV